MTKEEFCKAITVYTDTAEQRNQHLLEQLSEIGVRFKCKNLDYADYTFELDGKSYLSKIAVERKASLIEIASNFTSGRMRFKKEFERATLAGAKIILLIEDAEGREKICKRRELDKDKSLKSEQRWRGTWRSNFCANSMIGSLTSWKDRYGAKIVFCDKKCTAAEMIQKFYDYYCYAVKESVEG